MVATASASPLRVDPAQTSIPAWKERLLQPEDAESGVDSGYRHVYRGEQLLARAARNAGTSLEARGSCDLMQSFTQKTLMILANVILNAFSADAFLSKYSWFQDDIFRYACVGLLAYGTIFSNLFSKVPMLDAPEQGVGLNAAQLRIYRAMREGLWQSELFNQPTVDIYLSKEAIEALNYQQDGNQGRFTNFELHVSAHLLEAQFMSGKTADNQPAYRRLRILSAERATVLYDLGEQLEEQPLAVSGHAVAIRVDSSCRLNLEGQKAELQTIGSDKRYHAIFDTSALNIKKHLVKHPLMSAYYAFKWLMIRGMLGFAFMTTLNHSFFSLVTKFAGVKSDQSNMVDIVSPSGIIGLFVFAMGIGFYRGWSANFIQGDKTYKELTRAWTRIKHQRFSCPSLQQIVADLFAMIFVAISLTFNVSMSLYFGKDGIQTYANQWNWINHPHAKPVPVSSTYYWPVIGLLMVPNLTTAWATAVIETIKKFEVLCKVTDAPKRAHDSSHTDHVCVWRQVQITTVFDSMNYALVAANSAYQAWSHIFGSDVDGQFQPNDAVGTIFAWVMFVGIVSTAVPWSLSTAVDRFSGAYNLFCSSRDSETSRVLARGHDSQARQPSGVR